MTRHTEDDKGELLVRSQMTLGMLQTRFAKFLGVSDRTMRRWEAGGTRLLASTLLTLTSAVHAKDPALAARVAAAHGHTLEELGLGLSPDQRLAHAIVSAAAEVPRCPPARCARRWRGVRAGASRRADDRGHARAGRGAEAASAQMRRCSWS
jgi:DNA-binding XRE family transcriptional regulator